MERARRDPYLVFPLTAALLLGVIGFIPGLGFLGPLGQGSTGHVGLFLGWVVGVAAAVAKLTAKRFAATMLVSAALWTATLVAWGHYHRAW